MVLSNLSEILPYSKITSHDDHLLDLIEPNKLNSELQMNSRQKHLTPKYEQVAC